MSGYLVVYFGIVALVYLLPALIALMRGHHYLAPIVALNVTAGWTGIGYVVCLCWAVWPKGKTLFGIFVYPSGD